MSFYLQLGYPDNPEGYIEHRTFMDDRVHEGCAVELVIEAKNWRHARAKIHANVRLLETE